jgi:hypothetical protein
MDVKELKAIADSHNQPLEDYYKQSVMKEKQQNKVSTNTASTMLNSQAHPMKQPLGMSSKILEWITPSPRTSSIKLW